MIGIAIVESLIDVFSSDAAPQGAGYGNQDSRTKRLEQASMKERSQKFNDRLELTARPSRMVVKLASTWLEEGKAKWFLALILGLGAGLTGPYGTYFTYAMPVRIGYWLAVILAGFAIWSLIESMVARIFSPDTYILSRLTIIVPFAAINSLFVLAVFTVMSAVFGHPVPIDWSDLFVSHVVLSTIVILPAIIVIRKMRVDIETRAGGEAIDFLTQKLPPHLRGEVPLALGAEGHYVRVFTARGEDLVTMRFEDARNAVAGIGGLQVHRSWWIALDHLVEVKADGSAYEATMANGLKVPVSRRRRTELARELARNDR